MVYFISIAILVGLALMDYISYKKGGLIYVTGDSIAFNKLFIDVKIKIASINHVDIIVDKGTKKVYYLITSHNGVKFKTSKTELGSSKFNHAGSLLTKCGIQKFNTLYK